MRSSGLLYPNQADAGLARARAESFTRQHHCGIGENEDYYTQGVISDDIHYNRLPTAWDCAWCKARGETIPAVLMCCGYVLCVRCSQAHHHYRRYIREAVSRLWRWATTWPRQIRWAYAQGRYRRTMCPHSRILRVVLRFSQVMHKRKP